MPIISFRVLLIFHVFLGPEYLHRSLLMFTLLPHQVLIYIHTLSMSEPILPSFFSCVCFFLSASFVFFPLKFLFFVRHPLLASANAPRLPRPEKLIGFGLDRRHYTGVGCPPAVLPRGVRAPRRVGVGHAAEVSILCITSLKTELHGPLGLHVRTTPVLPSQNCT